MDEDLGDSCGLILRLLAQVLLYFNRLIDGGKMLTLPYKGLDASSDGYDDDNSLGSWFRLGSRDVVTMAQPQVS